MLALLVPSLCALLVSAFSALAANAWKIKQQQCIVGR